MTAPSASVLADSITEDGRRLTTMLVLIHRYMLPEFNTHRVLSRNSASSRAIPVEKQLARVEDDPAWPLAWPCEQPGMQGGADLLGQNLEEAQSLFRAVHAFTVEAVRQYLAGHPDKSGRLHKSLVNRLLEPFMWHTVVVSATEWDGFWDQRCSPLAQPEIRAAAEAMLHAAYETSIPRVLIRGDWHLPFITVDDREEAARLVYADPKLARFNTTEILKMVSVARCARTSYLTHDGIRALEKDLELFFRLVSATPMHASPLEHVARAAEPDEKPLGNFRGYRQYRHDVEAAIQQWKEYVASNG